MIRERRGVIQALVTSLVTKPFMLLTGISGSGKTQLARRLASGIAAGMFNDGKFSGLSFSGEATAQAQKVTLAKNGIIPDLLGNDGNAYIDVKSADDVWSKDVLKSSNFNTSMKNRVAFLPVRPDWTEPQKIWGYYNPLTGLYYPTQATLVALHAYVEFLMYGDAAPRHFIILDELNLARVEYYLSDILSLMECPTTLVDGEIRMGEMATVHPFNRPLWTGSAPKSEIGKEDSVHEQLYIGKMDRSWPLAYHYLSAASAGMMFPRMAIDVDEVIYGADWFRIIPPRMTFTPNLTIIGTVNVDETTFSFSPKVLDRAFVMEFNEMDYDRVCADWAASTTHAPHSKRCTKSSAPKTSISAIEPSAKSSISSSKRKAHGKHKAISAWPPKSYQNSAAAKTNSAQSSPSSSLSPSPATTTSHDYTPRQPNSSQKSSTHARSQASCKNSAATKLPTP